MLVFLGSSKHLPHFGLGTLVDCGTCGTFSAAGVGGQLGQMLLRPQKEGESVTEWTTVLRHISRTDLSQLHLQLILHIRDLGDASIESQIGVGELLPHLV